MFKSFILTIFCFLSISSNLFSQNWHTFNTFAVGMISKNDKVYTGYETLKEISRKTLSVETFLPVYNMLSQNYAITCINIDSTGVFWLGTMGQGYFKLENNTWVNYNTNNSVLPSNGILDISTAPNGDVFISTKEDGLLLISNSEEKLYKKANSALVSDSLRKVRFFGNKAYICTVSGINILEDSTLTEIKIPDEYLNGLYIYSISFDKKNNILISTKNTGILIYNGAEWVNYNTENSGITTNKINDISSDLNGNIYMTSDIGLIHFNYDKWTIYNTSNAPLKENKLAFLLCDPVGNIWISSFYNLYVFNPDGINPVKEIVKSTEFTISPNPSIDYITISNNTGDYSYEIINMFGIRQECKAEGNKIDIRELLPGAYVIIIKGLNNEVTGTQKFIKE